MSDIVIQALEAAAGLFRAERWPEAEAAYRAILGQSPGHAEALYRLSGVLMRVGRIDEALAAIDAALAGSASRPEYHLTRAELLRRASRLDEALAAAQTGGAQAPQWGFAHTLIGQLQLERGDPASATLAFNQALVWDPTSYGAQLGAGQSHERQGNWGAAADAYREAVRLRPDQAGPRHALATALAQQGDRDGAIGVLGDVLSMAPGHADAHNNLGILLNQRGDLTSALEHLRTAVAAQPGSATMRTNLANLQYAQGDNAGALAELDRALQLDPAHAEAHYNRGNVLRRLDRDDDAVASFTAALQLRPDHPEALVNLAGIHYERRQLEPALACAEHALRIRPMFVEGLLNRAIIRLLSGDYVGGWRDYQARLMMPAAVAVQRELGAPQWAGEDIAGRTILVYGEQGLGDCLQFMRYARLLAERGALVLLDLPAPLVALAQAQSGYGQVLEPGTATPAFDVHSPLLSLPLAFGTTLDSVPDQVPYLAPPADRAAAWAERLASLPPGLRIGLVWAGSPHQDDPDGQRMDSRRSVTLSALAPVLAVPGAVFVSLQAGDAAGQTAGLPGVLDVSAHLTDFAETAAAIAQLDLVIGVDTSTIHLAGALGKPTWLLNRFDGDWRWLMDRTDSPWYPTMRIYRQAEPGAWGPVIAAIASDLSAWVGPSATPR